MPTDDQLARMSATEILVAAQRLRAELHRTQADLAQMRRYYDEHLLEAAQRLQVRTMLDPATEAPEVWIRIEPYRLRLHGLAAGALHPATAKEAIDDAVRRVLTEAGLQLRQHAATALATAFNSARSPRDA
jgi:hypothetical protein